MHFRGRVIALALTLGMFVSGIISIFWYQEMRYSLPTPVPVNYQSVAVGEKVNLPVSLQEGQSYFLHFYNPDCPCSRFNVRHLRTLIGRYHDRVSILVVVDSEQSSDHARNEFGNQVEILVDAGSEIAKNCGVYSTPQAAIIHADGSLYYRGNYNSSRFCTSRATNFAELSLIALINNNPPPLFGILATQSYGCELENSSTSNSVYF
jgi:hypothetical protein